MGFAPLPGVSNTDTSLGDSVASYSTGCVAHTEKVLTQPSLYKVKPFPHLTLNAASTLSQLEPPHLKDKNLFPRLVYWMVSCNVK